MSTPRKAARPTLSQRTDAEALHFNFRLRAALRATRALRPAALEKLAASVRRLRRLSPEEAAALADVIGGRFVTNKGGRPKSDKLHQIVFDAGAVHLRWLRSQGRTPGRAEVYRYLARIRWPAEGNGETERIVLSASAIRSIIERKLGRAKPGA